MVYDMKFTFTTDADFVGLQVERGVITTRLQLLKPTPGERKTCVKFKENENKIGRAHV